MQKLVDRTLTGPFAWGLLALILMHALSLELRRQDFDRLPGARNLEATFHQLLTVIALAESPVTAHRFLPTVSLGGERNKRIPWGATVPTDAGDYVYTSFPPPGFLAPYAAFRILDAVPSLRNLARFNAALGVSASVLLFLLLYRVLSLLGHGPWTSASGALVASSVGVFSREALSSFGVIYWSHSLYQLMLVVSLWLVLEIVAADSSSETGAWSARGLVAVAFLGALTEWTGYVTNAGLALLFWFGPWQTRRSRSLAIAIAVVTAGAASLTILHYGVVVGFRNSIAALSTRFSGRSATSGSILELAQGYGLSYGAFLGLVIAGLVILALTARGQQANGERREISGFVLVAASLPLIENFVLLQHATEFTFDRLKFIVPAALVLALSFCRLSAMRRAVFALLTVACCIHGFRSYRADLRAHAGWAEVDAANQRLVQRVRSRVDFDCAVFLSDSTVRGYSTLLVHRAIYEHIPVERSMSLLTARDGCAAVHLSGVIAYQDLPSYTRATITYPDGSTESIDVRP